MLNFSLILRRFFLVTVLFLVAYLSHQPSLKPPMEWFKHQDKLFHLLEFGGLGLALVVNSDLFGKKRPVLLMILFGVIWAVTDEIHQYFIPGRFCSWEDLIADSIGLYLSISIFTKLLNKKRLK